VPRLVSLALAALGVSLSVALPASSSPRVQPNLAAYRGLGTWVDIYDGGLFRTPERAVHGMKRRGVRTLYLETGNYRTRTDVVQPAAIGRFIEAAHAAGIAVVAWYLPSLTNPPRDLRRSLAAVRLRTPTGQRFDSFALDIEASLVRSISLRNRRLLNLSAAIRQAAGPAYPLGAIIPSPRGMQLLPKYWPRFPYAGLGAIYDVFLPMGYFTYRTRSLRAAYDYTVRNAAIIRRATGDPSVPIHLIGGVADAASTAQVRGFVRAARDCGVAGGSLYDFGTTSAGHWASLAALRKPSTAPSTACY
jgi:hypothetical protein